MASSRSIHVLSSILALILHLSSALYEDQVGKFDWKRSFIGKVKFAHFDTKRILVATEENVLSSLNVKNGQILWRQILEDPKEQQIKLLHLNKDLFTVSGTSNSWFVRSWDPNSGTLLSEWSLSTEKVNPCEFKVINNKLVHVILTTNPIDSRSLTVMSYVLETGEKRGLNMSPTKTPWLTDASNCIVTNSNLICISSNDITGKLYVQDFFGNKSGFEEYPLETLMDKESGTIQIMEFEDTVPSFFLVTNNLAKLFYIEDGKVIKTEHRLMPNAVTVRNGMKRLLYQLEASSDPKKLIRVNCKEYNTGDDVFSIDLDYPVGLDAPIIAAVNTKGSNTDLLLSTTDSAILLVHLPEGKIVWTREEALSNIVATEFLELPVSELDASIENEFKTSSSSILNMLTHRLTTQAKQLSNLIIGGQLLSSSGLVRDQFGLHKIIVVATRAGKLFAIDTLSGSLAWSYRLPNVKPFKMLKEEKMLLFVQRTARYAPLPAQCTLLAEDISTGNGIIFQFDPITGYSQSGIRKLDYGIMQATLLPYEDEDNLKPILLLTPFGHAKVFPSCAHSIVLQHVSKLYMYLVDADRGFLKGFNFHHSSRELLKATPAWEVNISPSKLVAVSAKHPNERVHSQGRVLPDRSVYYKYVNPNLIALATLSDDPVHKHVLSVYLVDGVTGLILYSTSHKRAKGPVHLVHSENWLVYSYFNERFRRTEVVSAELYEGYLQSNSSVFSSHSVSLLPHVQTQSYILPATPSEITVTLTERGITNKFLLLALSNGAVIEIPWLLLQPRFQDIPCGPEESCIPYMPEIPLPPEAIINYNQSLARIAGIEVAPARLESTSHVMVHGLDIFYTRVAPSKTFDVLKEDFDHLMIVLVLTCLILASYLTKYLASKKALKQLWK